MLIQQLYIQGIRNLQLASKLSLHPELNVFIGANGSGKTSLLESIYFLALGRSFRTTNLDKIINFKQASAAVVASYTDQQTQQIIKVQALKYRHTAKIVRIGGTIANSIEVANLAPTQIIQEDSSKLLFKEPELRRKFLDWIAFYTNKNYPAIWRKYHKVLQQRNAALKYLQKDPKLTMQAVLSNLDQMLVALANPMSAIRATVWEQFVATFNTTWKDLQLAWGDLPSFQFFPGWKGDLLQQLREHNLKDLKFGHTTCGPHKADLVGKIYGTAIKDVLSRGQGKILALAMLLARTEFISINNPQLEPCQQSFTSVLLIDDLQSELDDLHVIKVIRSLCSLRSNLQILITGRDEYSLRSALAGFAGKWFALQEGEIKELAY